MVLCLGGRSDPAGVIVGTMMTATCPDGRACTTKPCLTRRVDGNQRAFLKSGFLQHFYAILQHIGAIGGSMEFVVSGIVGVVVLIYLTYALFNPEKF